MSEIERTSAACQVLRPRQVAQALALALANGETEMPCSVEVGTAPRPLIINIKKSWPRFAA